MSAFSSSLTTRLPSGTYYARVTPASDFGLGAASADVKFTIEGNGCSAPTFKPALTQRVVARTVRLKWSPIDPAMARANDRVAPVSYLLEAGSVPGAANLVTIPMQRASSLLTAVGPGRYYVRVRPVNMCGPGPASNEVVVEIR
jgi:hypothetical protein